MQLLETLNEAAYDKESDLLDVLLELWCLGMLQRTCQRPNLVIVGSSLKRGEHCKVNLVLKVVLGAFCLALLQPVSWLLTLHRHLKAFEHTSARL